MHEAWFNNEEHVRKTVGLLDKPVVQFPNAREVRDFFSLVSNFKALLKLVLHFYLTVCPSLASLLVASVLKHILVHGLNLLPVVIPIASHVGKVCIFVFYATSYFVNL